MVSDKIKKQDTNYKITKDSKKHVKNILKRDKDVLKRLAKM